MGCALSGRGSPAKYQMAWMDVSQYMTRLLPGLTFRSSGVIREGCFTVFEKKKYAKKERSNNHTTK